MSGGIAALSGPAGAPRGIAERVASGFSPLTSGLGRNIGTVLQSADGAMWIKTGSGNYDWALIATERETFTAAASYDIAVPSGWTVFRGIWSLSGGTAGANVVARANGGTCTRQANFQWSDVPNSVVVGGRVAFCDISRNTITAQYDATSGNMVAHFMGSVDTGAYSVGSVGCAYHSSAPTSVGLSASAGTVAGTVQLERIR